MGISCASQLANIWMAAMDNKIGNDSRLYERYMDDIIKVIKKVELESDLNRVNKLHANLTFTHETEDENGEIPFLDMKLMHKVNGTIGTKWYGKPTDTGLCINYHSLAPLKYKKNMIINLTHRVYNATSDWIYFHKDIQEAKKILDYNQYPSYWYESIIAEKLAKDKNRSI